MLIIFAISYGFAALWIAPVVFGVIFVFQSWRKLPRDIRFLRPAALIAAVAAAAFAGYWVVLILQNCYLLVFRSGGPGPLGLLVFPLFAAIGMVPTAALGLLFPWLSRRRSRQTP